MSCVCHQVGAWVSGARVCMGWGAGGPWVLVGLGHTVVCGPSGPGTGSPGLSQAAVGVGAGLPGPTAN